MDGSDHSLFGSGGSTYANVFTFLGRPLSRDLGDAVDAVVMGIPFDLATSGRPGARHGPTAVRQASAHLRWESVHWPWRFALADRLRLIDYGDLAYAEADADSLVEAVVEHAGRILAAGKTLLSIGGDHFVTLPLLRAHAQRYGRLALLHFDAHSDREPIPSLVAHGSMFFHAPREDLIDPERSVQVGIRTECFDAGSGFHVLDADRVNNAAPEAILEEIHRVIGSSPTYLSFDIDCLDPAFAPGTGTPVAGGLSSSRALQLVRGLEGLHIVGMDVVEVAPAYDHGEVTALAAAALALEMLHLIAAGRPDGAAAPGGR